MNTPVNFELAKLLKEKRFDKETLQAYVYRGIEHQSSFYTGKLTKDKLLCDIPAPTISDVIMWLYDKHDIWIQPMLYRRKPDDFIGGVYYDKFESYFTEAFNSPTEAYEAAIKYCLENIIK